MIALLLTLSLALGNPPPEPEPSRRCHFTGVCAGFGQCDDQDERCVTASQASCEASSVCAMFGSCDWIVGKTSCMGQDPSRCGPDAMPCKGYGNCKATKPDPRDFCQATAKGCPASEDCRVNGYCVVGRFKGRTECWPSAKGCRASDGCRRDGRCGYKPGGTFCVHDPKACPNTYECKKFGSCSSNGGICTFDGPNDCASSERCKVYGLCRYNYQSCDPTDFSCATTSCAPPDDTACQASQICERYGACTKNRARCSTQATTATCQTKTVKVNAVTASTTQQHFPGGSLVADHLIDGRYDTAWAPDPSAPYPHRLTFELSTPMRIAGFRLAGGHHKIDRDEGVLVHAFGFPLGVALFADGVVQDAYQLRRQATWQTQLVSPVLARVVTLELFDHETGKRYDHYAITEIELLVCE